MSLVEDFIAVRAAPGVFEVGWCGDIGPRAEVVIGLESEVWDHVGDDECGLDGVGDLFFGLEVEFGHDGFATGGHSVGPVGCEVVTLLLSGDDLVDSLSGDSHGFADVGHGQALEFEC